MKNTNTFNYDTFHYWIDSARNATTEQERIMCALMAKREAHHAYMRNAITLCMLRALEFQADNA